MPICLSSTAVFSSCLQKKVSSCLNRTLDYDAHIPLDWKRTFSVYWRNYQANFVKLLEGFDIHAKALNKLAQQEQTQHAQEISSQLTDHFLRYQDDRVELQRFLYSYEDDRIALRTLAQKQEEERNHEQYSKIQQWLSNPGDDEQEYHRRWRGAREKFPGTAIWLLNEAKVKGWMDQDDPESSILWVYGIKGAGTLSDTQDLGRGFVVEC